jgi:transposase
MKQYVGLDVSVKETSICIVDEQGKVNREVKVSTEPSAILAVLMDETLAIERIGLEAGAFSQWLYGALAEASLPVVCVETRHMKAALSAQRQARAQCRLACDERRASSRAALLGVIVGEPHAFAGDAVDVRRPVAHHA